MLILGIDTALTAATAVVARDGVVLAQRLEPMARGHQEAIATLTEQAMAAAGVGFRDLDRIGVVVGPGSFTGLRVGLAFAKGLALAWATPLVGVGALEALSASQSHAGRVLAVIDAGRGGLYRQWFTDGAADGPPIQAPVEVVAEALAAAPETTVIGPGAALLGHASDLAYPTPDGLIRAIARATIAPPQPLYLRAPDAKTLAERGVAR